MAPPPIPCITLLTDFGTSDVFVASMKGVILSINPEARIIDLTHGVPVHNIRAGAYLVQSASRYFPAGTIHVAVVDPGVGSSRRPILVSTRTHHFLSPDNGLLSFILADEPNAEVRELTTEKYFLRSIGPTFHGRDLFAPAAAWLSLGEPLHAFGGVVKNCFRFETIRPHLEAGNLVGEIQHVDRFGNLITNIGSEHLRELSDVGSWPSLHIRIQDVVVSGLQSCYANGSIGAVAALINSDGRLELFCNQGRADQLVNAAVGDHVEVFVP